MENKKININEFLIELYKTSEFKDLYIEKNNPNDDEHIRIVLAGQDWEKVIVISPISKCNYAKIDFNFIDNTEQSESQSIVVENKEILNFMDFIYKEINLFRNHKFVKEFGKETFLQYTNDFYKLLIGQEGDVCSKKGGLEFNNINNLIWNLDFMEKSGIVGSFSIKPMNNLNNLNAFNISLNSAIKMKDNEIIDQKFKYKAFSLNFFAPKFKIEMLPKTQVFCMKNNVNNINDVISEMMDAIDDKQLNAIILKKNLETSLITITKEKNQINKI